MHYSAEVIQEIGHVDKALDFEDQLDILSIVDFIIRLGFGFVVEVLAEDFQSNFEGPNYEKAAQSDADGLINGLIGDFN